MCRSKRLALDGSGVGTVIALLIIVDYWALELSVYA